MKNWQFIVIVALLLIILTLIVIESSTIVNVYKVLKTTWL